MSDKHEFLQFEFYAWIEDTGELVSVLEEGYELAEAREIPARLHEAGGLLDLDPGLGSDHFVGITLMAAEPAGTYIGEDWANITSAEAWQRIFEFQRRCFRTCVVVTGTGLPPENLEEFLELATQSQKGLF